MAFVEVNGTRLHYEDSGEGGETIVFSHGLLLSGEMFRAQVAALRDRYRCVVYDHRGQGRSAVARSGYDMDSVAGDAAELIRKLDCAPCHFVGLSMGGFVGLRLAIRQPELLRSLTLIESTADPEPEENKPGYRRLALVGRWLGFKWVAGPVMKILFGRSFLDDDSRRSERDEWKRRLIANDRVGSARAAQGVIDREGVFEALPLIRVPVLILVGDEDIATPPEKSRRMAGAISGSRLVTIAGAGHSSTIEQPQAVNEALLGFLLQHRKQNNSAANKGL